MFTYQDAFVKEPGLRGHWHQKDVGFETLAALYGQYDAVIFKLTSPYYDQPQALRLADIPDALRPQNYTGRVTDFFNQIGNATLPVSSNLPTLERVYAHYQDARQAGYNVEPVNRTYNQSLGLDRSYLTDLQLTCDGIDYATFYQECLVTVNGFFHRLNYAGTSVNVLDGATSGFHANRYHVGIHHFGEVGSVETVPIRDNDIHGEEDGSPLKNRVYIKLDERVASIENKSVMLVIGGYLHLLEDGIFSRAGERLYTLDFPAFSWPQRFNDMRAFMDLSELMADFDRSTANASQVAIQDLFSDNTIRKLLTMSQSFFVIADTPQLTLDVEYVEFTKLPGRFVTHQPPLYPLYSGLGRFYEYWAKWEYDRWVLATDNEVKPHYLFETLPWANENSLDSSRYPAQPFEHPQAFFWKLGRYL